MNAIYIWRIRGVYEPHEGKCGNISHTCEGSYTRRLLSVSVNVDVMAANVDVDVGINVCVSVDVSVDVLLLLNCD